MDDALLQRRACHFGRVHDTGLYQIFKLAGGGIVAVVGVLAIRALSRSEALPRGLRWAGNLTERFLASAPYDIHAGLLVAFGLERG